MKIVHAVKGNQSVDLLLCSDGSTFDILDSDSALQLSDIESIELQTEENALETGWSLFTMSEDSTEH